MTLVISLKFLLPSENDMSSDLHSLNCLVVFENRPAVGLLGWLKYGFRHCYTILMDDEGPILFDMLKTEARIIRSKPVDQGILACSFAALGNAVLCLDIQDPAPTPRNYCRALTCVEIVKRLCRVPHLRAITPHQLFRSLQRIREESA